MIKSYPVRRGKTAFTWIITGVGLLISNLLYAKPAPPDFSRDVLPILSNYCFHCHGPDESSREADLRLDREADALRMVQPVIVRGHAVESELIKRIESTDPDSIMPPPDTKKNLKPAEIETLRRWIDGGAAWGKHWAFEAPRPPTIDKQSKLHPIDQLVTRELKRHNLTLSPLAERRTLIRRVTLDLTGLPPTPEEVAAFLADESPEAFEKVVDRLLASTRYGERMAWDWLEAARYADTNGYQNDPTRSMWYWRDWLIQALNENRPFDRFTIEMLAGDLLPDPSRDQLVATGFHRNHMINGEGGRIAEESRVDYVQDRVETTGTIWLGLTLNCCRCHSHKFDPITHKEYYSLAAYFNSIDETGANDAGGLAHPIINMESAEEAKRLAELEAVENAANKARQATEQALRKRQPVWEEAVAAYSAAEPNWQPLKPVTAIAQNGASLSIRPDHSILAGETNPEEESYTITFENQLDNIITGLRLEALADDSLPGKGPGRAPNGNFVLTELTLSVNERDYPLHGELVDFSQKNFSAAAVTDGNQRTGWAVMPAFGKNHTLILLPKQRLTNKTENKHEASTAATKTKLALTLSFKFGRQHSLGCFRLSVTSDPIAKPNEYPDSIRRLVAIPKKERNEEQTKQLFEFFRDRDPEFLASKKVHDAAKKERETFEKSLPRTMIMRERKEPRVTTVLQRGIYNKPGEEVSHGVPAVLPQPPADAPKSRLGLARWLVASENPLTARVIVNRMWQQLFGIGLVKTVEDFGVQGEKPLHPELLDWLAIELQTGTHGGQGAWNIKRLQRQILLSQVYRQKSTASAALRERDPENRLLARGPRYRIPSWMIRDQALAVSGLLAEQIGGPPVKGYQPEGIWEEATFGIIKYQQDSGAALYRRSLYQFWRRIVGPTMFFDTPNRQVCQVKQSRTNTPLHALTTLNDVTYIEASRVWAQQLLSGERDDSARLIKAYQQLLARRPAEEELTVLNKSLDRFREHYQSRLEAAEQLLNNGEAPRDKSLAAGEHAAWTALCGVLLNLDEALTKE